VFAAEPSDAAGFRETLTRIFELDYPLWLERLPIGRARALDGVDPDLRQCLAIAETLGQGVSALEWWDALGTKARLAQQMRRLLAGRAAERRTVEFEHKRLEGTGLEPKWVGIEDNTLGFDVKSWRPARVDEAGAERDVKGAAWREHAIEVKSAMRGEPVRLTRREVDEATARADRWELQIWLPDQLAPRIVPLVKLVPHIPVDNGAGQWSEVRVSLGAILGD
jgi:hypothetical protein